MEATSVFTGPIRKGQFCLNHLVTRIRCYLDLKEIVEHSLEEVLRVWDDRFRETYGPLHPRVRDLCERFLRCGDLHFIESFSLWDSLWGV